MKLADLDPKVIAFGKLENYNGYVTCGTPPKIVSTYNDVEYDISDYFKFTKQEGSYSLTPEGKKQCYKADVIFDVIKDEVTALSFVYGCFIGHYPHDPDTPKNIYGKIVEGGVSFDMANSTERINLLKKIFLKGYPFSGGRPHISGKQKEMIILSERIWLTSIPTVMVLGINSVELSDTLIELCKEDGIVLNK